MTHELIENEVDTEILRKQDAEEIEKLEEMIGSHDCHLSPEDSCQCSEWTRRIAELQNSYI